MKPIHFHPLTINLDACGDIEFLQQPLAQGQPPARVRISREMIPAVTKALSRLEKDGLIRDCREVLE